jgi:hypothetical protein
VAFYLTWKAREYDAVLIATAHEEYTQFDFGKFNVPLIDPRNRAPRR